MMTEYKGLANSTIDDPKQMTRRLLEAMSIKTVINVDDDACVENEASLESVVAGLRADTLDRRLVLGAVASGEEDGAAQDRDADDVIALVQERWDELSDDRRAELTLAARRAERSEELSGQGALLALPELLEGSAEFLKMSLARWREEGPTLLQGEDPMLVLFDRSFEHEGQSKTAGEELVKELLVRDDLPHVYVGLLTHTAEDVGHEVEIAQALNSELGESSRSVIVIAKSRLGSDPTQFPEALRMVLYADELEALRTHAAECLEAASCEAKKFLMGVERYALMATLEAAKTEGSYETDNVMRMVSAPGRRTLEQRLRDTNFVDGPLSKLRSAAAVDLYFDGSPRPESLAEITWQERFDSGEHLSVLAMPVEVGDIFRLYDLLGPEKSKGADRFYILLAQSCDLQIRSDGKRSNDVQNVVLTQLKPAASLFGKPGFKEPKNSQADIGHFIQDSGTPWRVDFAYQIQVPAMAIDACVVNTSGQASIGPSCIAPNTLPMSWVLRLEKMKIEAGKKIEKFRHMEEALAPVDGKETDAKAAMSQLGAALAGAGVRHTLGLTARVDTASEVIEYGIARHARITDATAHGLLTLSAQHHARPAFDNGLLYEPGEECGG